MRLHSARYLFTCAFEVQQDVLRRAAADQLANQASLRALIAREEDLKAKAIQKASAARGPRIRWRYYTDTVPVASGAAPADAAATGAAPSTYTSGASCGAGSDVCSKGEDGTEQRNREKSTRVGRCMLAFVEMTPDTVPSEYRPRTLNDALHAPKDICVKSDGSMQQRVRRLMPQEKAQTAGESAASRSGLRQDGTHSLSCQGQEAACSNSKTTDRMLGIVEAAITGKLRQQYGDMSFVVESVDGFQGMHAMAAQHIATMCVPDPLRGMHGGDMTSVGILDQGGAHVARAVDVDMSTNGHHAALQSSSIKGSLGGGMGMNLNNNIGGVMDWQQGCSPSLGVAGLSGCGDWKSSMPVEACDGQKGVGKRKIVKIAQQAKGKGGQGSGKRGNVKLQAAGAHYSAQLGPPALAAACLQSMHMEHAHAPMQGSGVHVGTALWPSGLHELNGGGIRDVAGGQQHAHAQDASVPNAGCNAALQAAEFQHHSQPLGMHPALNHVNKTVGLGSSDFGHFRAAQGESVLAHPAGVGGGYGKLDSSTASRGVLPAGGLSANRVPNGLHAPLGDFSAGAGMSFGGAALQPGLFPQNGLQHRPHQNGGKY
jgi:hypothetical protein